MAQPILWATKAVRTQKLKRWNPETGQVEIVIDPDTGQPLIEKVPQRAHDGDSDYKKPSMVHPTWIHYLRHDGHCARVKLTTAAADLDLDQSTAKYHRAKARHFGWIPLSSCPRAMLMAGQIGIGQLRADEAKQGDPCPQGSFGEFKPCPHFVAEEKARKAANAKVQAARDAAYQGEADKILKGQKEQTRDIATAVAGAVADALKGKTSK